MNTATRITNPHRTTRWTVIGDAEGNAKNRVFLVSSQRQCEAADRVSGWDNRRDMIYVPSPRFATLLLSGAGRPCRHIAI
jgi:hypothetical protein